MKWLVIACITATVAYWLLQNMEDAKNAREGRPRASAGKRVATFFFILILCIGIFYWFGANTGHDLSGGGYEEGTIRRGDMPRPSIAHPPRLDKHLLETHMIKNIREDIHVGGAPF